MNRIGFCCHVLNLNRSKAVGTDFRSATVTYASSLSLVERRRYLTDIVEHNLQALDNCLRWLAQKPPAERMFRITSGLTPLYTHACAQAIYRDPAFEQAVADRLARIGANYRLTGIRLSFHPGQFCVLGSASETTRRASIAEFEHHVCQAEWLGYRGGNCCHSSLTGSYDEFAINVHGGAWHGHKRQLKRNLRSWDWSWNRLSASARRFITIENDEFAWNSSAVVALCRKLGVRPVIDVHHHWINTGQWLEPETELAQQVRRLWTIGTPKLHVSLPKPQLWQVPMNDAPLAARHNWWRPLESLNVDRRSALRAHSNYLWHPGIVPYLLDWQTAGWDLMVESKLKNLASHNLAQALNYYRYNYT